MAIMQRPNKRLVLAIGLFLLARILPIGRYRLVGNLARTMISAWALDEVARGNGWFRRLLGVVGLTKAFTRARPTSHPRS